MAFEKLPSGTYGARMLPPSNPVVKLMARVMAWWHRRRGNRFLDMDVLYLTTVGAKTGQHRETPVARIADGDAWLIIASAAGARTHPGWYHNIAEHPDQVWIEVDGVQQRVQVDQVDGAERTRAWSQVTSQHPRYADYQRKTDRQIPVLRLTPVSQ